MDQALGFVHPSAHDIMLLRPAGCAAERIQRIYIGPPRRREVEDRCWLRGGIGLDRDETTAALAHDGCNYDDGVLG